MTITLFKKAVLTVSIASSAFLMTMGSATVMGAAPMVKTPAPGFFRVMLGAYEVTAVSDGTVELPVEKLLVEPEATTVAALTQSFLKTPLETSVNAFLINTGSKLVLIDTGAGGLFGPTLGRLIANIKASGYEPSQIDDIFITHMHGDHVGGLVTNGKLNFPNATVHADQREAAYWLSKANMQKATEDKKGMYQGAMDSVNPYVAAKKIDLFKNNAELVPGIKSYSNYGHTEGHTVYVVESEGQKLLLVGDLIHVTSVQLEHPEVTIAFDTNQKEAASSRDKVFTEAAQQGALVGAAHIQFPGLGHLRKDGKSYSWIPVNYTQMH